MSEPRGNYVYKKKVLLTGAGAPGGPGIIKALLQSEGIELIVADCDAEASGRFLNESFEQIPKADDPSFIPEIKRICSKHNIEVVFPLVTRELFQFANHKKEFLELGVRVIVSNINGLQIANDKSKLYEHLHQNNISVPEFYVVNTVDEFVNASKKLGCPEKAFCFKPCIGNGSRGFRIVSDSINESELLFNFKPNTTFIRYEKALEILSSEPFPQLLVSEFLPGDEFTVDTIINNGVAKLILPRKRTQMREGISIKGVFENNEHVISYCKQIIQSLELHGPIGIQVKQALDGTYKILEINPRIQGTSVASMGMGINLPWIAIMQEFYPVEKYLPQKIEWGTKFTRFYSEVFY